LECPSYPARLQVEQNRSARVSHRQQHLVTIAVGRGEGISQCAAEILDAVGVQRVSHGEVRGGGQHSPIGRLPQSVEQRNLLDYTAGSAVQLDNVVIQPGRLQIGKIGKLVVAVGVGES